MTGVEKLVELLRVGEADGVREYCTAALANLSSDDRTRATIRCCGGVEALIRIMADSGSSAEREYAVAALASQCTDQLSRQIVIAAGGIATLVRLLRGGETAAEREWAAATLGILTNCTRDTQNAVREFGGVEALVQLLKPCCTSGERELAAATLGILGFQVRRPAIAIARVVTGAPAVPEYHVACNIKCAVCVFQNRENQDAIFHAHGLVPLLEMVRDGETNGERKEATFAVSSLATGNEQIERAVTDWRMEHCCLECTPFLPPPAARGLTLMPQPIQTPALPPLVPVPHTRS